MRINADFSQRVMVSADEMEWVASPQQGVDRIMLDRIGDEVARATSIVRYAAGSSFNRHLHPQGEEFLVLEGMFSDEHCDYPAGSYVRNPPGTGHSPYSTNGCRILVKLRQFDPSDLTPFGAQTLADGGWQQEPATAGQRKLLFHYESEFVDMVRYAAGSQFTLEVGDGGMEWLLVDGDLSIDGNSYSAESWFRFPGGDHLEVEAHTNVLIWQKTGHIKLDDVAGP